MDVKGVFLLYNAKFMCNNKAVNLLIVYTSGDEHDAKTTHNAEAKAYNFMHCVARLPLLYI